MTSQRRTIRGFPPDEDRQTMLSLIISQITQSITERPVTVATGTALAVTLCYFSANALWYQPMPHTNTFFQTRPASFVQTASLKQKTTLDAGRNKTRIIIQKEEEVAQGPAPALPADPDVLAVQEVLGQLDLYDGEIDGLYGPQTARAISTYRRIMKLPEADGVDQALLQTLGIKLQLAEANEAASESPGVEAVTTASVPIPTPRSSVVGGVSVAEPSETKLEPRFSNQMAEHTITLKVQAGLREFGNDAITLDGKAGPQTTAAIREFQSLFGLKTTGRIDDALVAKMTEIGLIGG